MINEKMAQNLINLGIKKDDTILMHSSLSSLGYIEGGAETVIDTLLSVLTEEPFTYTLVDENGNKTKKDYFRHNFHASNAQQRYDRLANVMDIECKKVLEANYYLIDAAEMWKTADKYIKEDNNYFIDTEELT